MREALAIYRSLGNRHGIASALNQLGIIAYSEGLFAEALEHFEEVYDLHRASGDRIAQSGAMNNLGLATYALGRYEAARDWHLQALAIREQLGFEGRIGQSEAAHFTMPATKTPATRPMNAAVPSGPCPPTVGATVLMTGRPMAM